MQKENMNMRLMTPIQENSANQVCARLRSPQISAKRRAVRSLISWMAPIVGVVALTSLAITAVAQSFSDVEGKWTARKKDPRYGEVVQTVEFKNNTFTYRVVTKDNETLLYAKGKASVDKLGPFNVIKLTEIEGGNSEYDLWPANDDRTVVYVRGYNTLTAAVNFDRDRPGEEPEAVTYTKVKQ